MNGRFLLDTNIIIAIFAKDSSVLEQLAQAAEVFVPSIVLGELFYGAAKSKQPQANIARIEEFAARAAVLACNTSTGREYGRIKNDLRIQGRPIPENDIWIAAIAMQHGLTVVSRDGHFDAVANLAVTIW
jgi:tRNA(fMet)-specific endonuclease VapC